MWEELPSASVSLIMDRDRRTSNVVGRGARLPLVPPCARVDTERLPDGAFIRIEPLKPGDRASVRGLFARLSAESRMRRFLSPMPTLSERDLSFLSDVGHVIHQAMTAVDPADGAVAGIARYVQHQGRPGVADVAVAVADEMQRRGIGTVLMDRLIACAQANGFQLLTATTLWENRAARALLRTMGFQATGSVGAEIELQLRLGAAPAPVPGPPVPGGLMAG
jgi:GNAT superfamily N-acetyltransferase